MFFIISLRIAIVINIIALVLHIVMCFISNSSGIGSHLRDNAGYCRWIGFAYLILAWFVGDGSIQASGMDTYSQVAYWMLLFSIGWLAVFLMSIISNIWNPEDKKPRKSITSAFIYFILAFLLH